MLRSLFIAVLFAASMIQADATETTSRTKQTFERDVRPILKAHCFQCHGETEEPEAGLDLRLRRFMIAGGDSGEAIVPGEPDASQLLDRIISGDMPPGEGAHVSAEEIETVRQWIIQGAPTARPEPETLELGLRITPEDRAFWSFQPIRPAVVPSVKARDRVRTPIDAFVLARLEGSGLTFSPEADRRKLIRRATIDLLGVTPTWEETEAFIDDAHPDAYERLIDRLLASPRYGERWGRHWLDVVGYADSEGHNEADTVRPHAYRYRDYVIGAFNRDRPFDEFIREQLAGDEMISPPYNDLAPDQIEKLVATGFLRMAPDGTGSRNDDQALARNTVVTETVKIVSSSLLGLTVACAECHDHRFDPISQKDFYRLRAVFEPALDWKDWRDPRGRQISLLSEAEKAEAKRLEKEAAAVEAQLKPKLEEFRDWVFEKEVEQIPAAVRHSGRAAGLAWQQDSNQLTPQQQKLLEEYPGLKVPAEPGRLNLFLGNYGRQDDLKQVLEENKAQAAAVRARKPTEAFVRALTEKPGQVPVTYLFHRGDRTQPGDAVAPGDLRVLSEAPLDFAADDPNLTTTGRRTALARRLTDGSHPLVARVLVNRFWMQHFGQGIVATPGDFGSRGQRPTHPELLDWLASELMANGWRLKPLHKLIMTSSVYRQAANTSEEAQRIDAANGLYWRMPLRRMEAEAIRDSVLATSGTLRSELFGPPVAISLDEAGQPIVGNGPADASANRRSIYVQQRRSMPSYLLEVFDAPEMDPNCERRESSTVAPQSLMLMNNAFMVHQSEAFARRVRHEAGSDPQHQVRRAWRLAFVEDPATEQIREMLNYLDEQTKLMNSSSIENPEHQALASLCQILFGSNRFLYVD